MRRYVILFVFSLAFVASYAQTESMKFSGIIMDQTYTSFIEALKQKGYSDNVKQEVKNVKGYKFVKLAGNFWHFDDCEICVKYSTRTDSVTSVSVNKEFFSVWHKKVFELMDNFDLKYGERLRLKGDVNNSKYRWISKEPFGMVEVSWVMMKEYGLDLFWVEYFTSEETRDVLKREIKEKKEELDEL